MSRRTDGGPASKQAIRYISNMPAYGDAQQLMDMQASAPMAKTNVASSQPQVNVPANQSAQASFAQQALTPLTAPTQRPNEPVTAGAASGPGPGPDILGNLPIVMGGSTARQTVQALASKPDASPELQHLAAQLGQ
jgi:hypothetical protein